MKVVEATLRLPWQLYWLGFLTSTPMEALLRDLPLPDAADQELGMTTAEAVEVSLNTTLLTPVYPDIEHDLIHPCYITRVKIYVLI